MRRYSSPFNGNRYVLNKTTGEIHDLDNETSFCHIDEMNPDNVIATSLDKSVKDITNGKIDEVLNLDDEQLQKAVQQNQLLMNYSITLLKTYHDELRKELATHGIEI